MYLEDRMRALEERIAALESQGRGQAEKEVVSRLDALESACHDLMDSDEKLSRRCTAGEDRLGDFGKQLEVLFEQLAELDSRSSRVDLSPIEQRLSSIENELGHIRGIQDEGRKRLEVLDQAVASGHSRLAEMEASNRRLVERLADGDLVELGRQCSELGSLLTETRSSVARHSEQIQEVAACAEETLARLERLEPTARTFETRQTSLERDAVDLRKEVAWLRDRPQVSRGDGIGRIVGAGGLAAAIAALILLFWPQDTVRAKRFLVVNGGEKPLAEIGADQSVGSIRLYAASGVPQVDIGAHEDATAVRLLGSDGAERVRLSVAAHKPELTLYGRDRAPDVRLIGGANENGLRVYDPSGHLRVGVGLCRQGAAVNLFDPQEQRRVVLCSGDETSALSFLGEKEMQRTTLGITQRDESILNFHDPAGKQRVLVFAGDRDAGLQVLDRDTNVLFSSP